MTFKDRKIAWYKKRIDNCKLTKTIPYILKDATNDFTVTHSMLTEIYTYGLQKMVNDN